jgi:hypothetical protein
MGQAGLSYHLPDWFSPGVLLGELWVRGTMAMQRVF